MLRCSGRIIVLAGMFGLWPGIAAAQSQFTGLVIDESKAALPGVTVEVSSPVLIEKVRTATTDGTGRYTIVNLRPGTYRLSFTLAGFATTVREGVELPSNFVATVNVELKVGSLEESITVSGATPTVDTQQAARTVVLGRDMIDALPTTRSIQSVGQMIPGVRLSDPDVGGERILEASAMRAHGMGEVSQTMYVDGMNVSASDGGQLPYTNDQMDAEINVRLSALPAEISSGGVNLNSIPKDGGNIYTGAAFIGGSLGSWQSDNITPELQARGLDRANAMAHIRVFSASIGGPIKRDKMWFFFGVRHADADEIVADTPAEVTLTAIQLNRAFSDACSGGTCVPFSLRPGDVERTQVQSYMRDVMLRLTTQLTSRNKLAILFNRGWKDKDNEYGYGTDPVFASNVRDNKNGLYPWGYVKWTSPVTSRLLLEAGWAWSVYAKTINQKEFNQLPYLLPDGRVNPDWLRNARRQDSALNQNPYCTLPDGCNVWWTGGQNNQQINARYPVSASASYVTGSHNIKTGFTWSFGPDRQHLDRQADLIQRYVNGVPQSVQVFSTPIYVNAYMARDLGFYAQDTWTIKRLTLNPGVRVEYFNARMNAIAVPAGRFVPDRFFPEENNLPNWNNDVAPRVSVAYDVFGTGRTAVKASWSKYYAQDRSRFASRYARAGQVNEVRNWFDVDLIPGTSTRSGIPKPTDNDDIAQDSEIGPTSQANFGTRATASYDPDIQRASNVEFTAGVNHEVMPRIAVGLFYYHRSFQNLTSSDRTQITLGDYTQFQLRMPDFSNDPTLAGLMDPSEMLTIYNLNPAKRGVYGEIMDRNGIDDSIYDGFETSFTARLPNGANVYGGWTIERMVGKYCDNNDNPNGGTVTTEFGKVVANGGRFCDESQFDIPFRSDVKIAGSTPLPYGINFGAVYQTYPGAERVITWTPAASLFPDRQRTNSETIILSTPGTIFQPRYNQIDINFRKNFRHGNKVFTAQFDVFNLTNSSSILETNDSIGGSLGEIGAILKGRMPRIAFQMRF